MRMYGSAVVLAVAGVISVWVLCLVPMHPGGGGQYTDKIQHLSAYLLQVLTMLVLFPRHRWKIVAWFVFQGALIEGLQAQTSYRSAELADMLANTLGIALGLALSYAPVARRLSAWLRGQPG